MVSQNEDQSEYDRPDGKVIPVKLPACGRVNQADNDIRIIKNASKNPIIILIRNQVAKQLANNKYGSVNIFSKLVGCMMNNEEQFQNYSKLPQ